MTTPNSWFVICLKFSYCLNYTLATTCTVVLALCSCYIVQLINFTITEFWQIVGCCPSSGVGWGDTACSLFPKSLRCCTRNAHSDVLGYVDNKPAHAQMDWRSASLRKPGAHCACAETLPSQSVDCQSWVKSPSSRRLAIPSYLTFSLCKCDQHKISTRYYML